MTGIGYQLSGVIFCPFQIVVALVLLYSYIGISFLVGTGVLLFIMLITFILTSILKRLNNKLLKAKD